MTRYVAGRVLEMLPVALLVSLGSFFLIHLVPGDPVRASLGPRADPQLIEERRGELGLERPLPTQYWDYMSGAATGDFGRSIDRDEDVSDMLARGAPPSLLLVVYAILVSLLLAVPLAVLSAARRGTWIDRAIQVLPTITFVMPGFWLALLLIMIFSLQLGVLPTSGYGETLAEHLRGLTLPAITLGLGIFPLMTRLLRSSVIDAMGSEYVEAARSRGLTESRVLFKHVLRNSVTSTVTLTGLLLGVLLSATVIVEQIFAIPGLGSMLVGAVGSRDFPVVQALTLLFGLAVLVASLLTDVAYAVLDPRVRL